MESYLEFAKGEIRISEINNQLFEDTIRAKLFSEKVLQASEETALKAEYDRHWGVVLPSLKTETCITSDNDGGKSFANFIHHLSLGMGRGMDAKEQDEINY